MTKKAVTVTKKTVTCKHGVARVGRYRRAEGCAPCTQVRIRVARSRALALRASEGQTTEVCSQEISILRHLYNKVMLFLYGIRFR